MKLVAIATISLVLSACSTPIKTSHSALAAADPTAPHAHRPSIAGHVPKDFKPVEPKPWVESNERLSPAEEPS